MALQYCLLNEQDLFNQVMNSIQRQLRILGKDTCEHIHNFCKILKIAVSDAKKEKSQKIKSYASRADNHSRKLFSPTKYIKIDDKLLHKLGAE